MTRQPWSAQEVAELVRRYPHEPTDQLAVAFGRTRTKVYCKAAALGLKKTEQYLTRQGGRIRPGEYLSPSTRFTAGHAPWNKGTHFTAGGRSKETRFKPGALNGKAASLYLPVGTERMADGYLVRKVADTKPAWKGWIPVHRLLWEEHNGPIPNGHALTFRNGDRTDIRLDNLECISRSELIRRNSIHRLPKEIADTCRLIGQVNRQINKRQRHAKQD